MMFKDSIFDKPIKSNNRLETTMTHATILLPCVSPKMMLIDFQNFSICTIW